MTDHTALIERLEKAEAGSRFTNDDAIGLCKALGLFHRATVNQGLARRALNGSVDAALALVERAEKDPIATLHVALFWAAQSIARPGASDIARYVCIALLKALRSQQKGEESQ